MPIMKHWKAEGCDAKDFRLAGTFTQPGSHASLDKEEAN
jgi:hypothetical protein